MQCNTYSGNVVVTSRLIASNFSTSNINENDSSILHSEISGYRVVLLTRNEFVNRYESMKDERRMI